MASARLEQLRNPSHGRSVELEVKQSLMDLSLKLRRMPRRCVEWHFAERTDLEKLCRGFSQRTSRLVC